MSATHAQPPHIALYRVQEESDEKLFMHQMQRHGWELHGDFYNNPSMWSKNGRIVAHTIAFDYFKHGRVLPWDGTEEDADVN